MLRGFFLDYLGFELDRAIEPADWLTFREQKLQTITAGANPTMKLGTTRLDCRQCGTIAGPMLCGLFS